MESTASAWAARAVFLLLTCDMGVLGRAVNARGVHASSPRGGAGSPARSSTAAAVTVQRCAELAAPWRESLEPAPEGNASLPLQLRVRPFSPRSSRGVLLFPGKALFSFVRRVYRCCQERPGCSSVKGIPGRLRGGTAMEFLLTGEMLSLTTVTRAELHLQLSNPQDLAIRPLLSAAAKRGLPTRYSVWSSGSTVELRVDLLNLLRSVQEQAAAAPRTASIQEAVPSSRRNQLSGEATGAPLQDSGGQWKGGPGFLPGRDLGLLLGCTGDESAASCEGVQLLHTPFMAVYYS